MNRLIIINELGLKITWNLISFGLHGVDRVPALLTREEVVEFLKYTVTEKDENAEKMITLIVEENCPDSFSKLIRRFASEEDVNTDLEIRKWRAFLLYDLLEKETNDCFQGVLELMEFWSSMGFPDDCPQTFPSCGDKAILNEYFSEASYNKLVDQNRNWLKNEIADIIRLET